uniref:Thiamine-monophosphate kinase n=1 Tax=Chlorobium chlorochromatii (strain CaD3) TaxID=340177 RepID=Q3ARA0_CHLCH
MPLNGEFTLIDTIAHLVQPTLANAPTLLQGIGDDCAIMQPTAGMVEVATTDLLVESVHFDLLTTPLSHLGSKAISVNVSDICAMNALPRYALVSLALPPTFSKKMVEELYGGMVHAAQAYGIAIAGGDTSASRSGLMISITAIGEALPTQLTRRSGAQLDDLLCVTGTLGGSMAGLKLLMREKEIMLEHLRNNEPVNRNLLADLDEYRELMQRHLLPTARLDVVRLFHRLGIQPTAMIDISDGLSSEVQHICRHSNCGALLHESRIPIHATTRQLADEMQEEPLTWALTGGEEYQLLFTLPEATYQQLAHERDIHVIGTITPTNEGMVLEEMFGIRIDLTTIHGFDHFAPSGNDDGNTENEEEEFEDGV